MECFLTKSHSKPILAIALAVLAIFIFPLPRVNANPQPVSSNPLTREDNVPMTYVNGIPPVHQYTITLITGDVLYASRSGNGPWTVAVKEAPRQYGNVPFQTFSDSAKGTYVVPADIVSLMPNFLDPYLFDLDYITANHLNDESTSVLGAIVQYAPGSPLSNQWDTNSVQYSNLPIVNSQALSIPKENAADFGRYILNHPLSLPKGVEKIWLDKVHTASDDVSLPMIGGDLAQNVLGYNGSGINIAIVDTGIDATHPDFFFPNGTSKVIVQVDAVCMVQPVSSCDGTAKDLFGHGTHVASIAAGTGAASGGRFIGVAPGASLMNIKVINKYGFGYDSWIISGLQLAAQGVNGVKADVISMSLGGSPTDGSDPLSLAINQIVADDGIPVVIAAGNLGCSFCVTSPGAADDAITVAATTKAVSPASPSIASFSGRGPRFDNFDIKPDIAAPGVGITAACSSTALPIPCPRGSHYVTLSGTSMATPHVSGSVALLLQQARQRGVTLTPAEIKDTLQSSSVVLPSQPGQPDVDIYQQGAGLVRVDRALETNVIFNSSEISFGGVPYTASSLQRVVQVINLGMTTITLNLSYAVTDVQTPLSPLDNGTLHSNLVSLDKTQLTIAPGSSSTITLTIDVADAPTMKLWNIFSGRIFATSGNTTFAHAIFGFAKEGRRQTVFLAGINVPIGSQDFIFPNIAVYDALDPLGFENSFVNVDSNGQATLRLPLSDYNFVMTSVVLKLNYCLYGYFCIYYYYYYRIDALEVPVTTSPANVTLDATKARPVSLNLRADPQATKGLQQDDSEDYIRSDGSDVQDVYSIFYGTWDLYAVNNASANLGTYWTYDRWLVTHSPDATSPVLYDISMTNHTQHPITHVVNDLSSFAKTFASYKAATDFPPSTFGRWSFPMAFEQTVSFTTFYEIAPTQRIEYQQPTEASYRHFFDPYAISIVRQYPFDFWEPPFWLESTHTINYFGFQLFGIVDAPGETHNETWDGQPVHPSITLAERQGNNLILDGFEVTDNSGHFGNGMAGIWGWGVNFELSVYVSGELRTVRNATQQGLDAHYNLVPLPPINVSLPKESAMVEVAMQMQPVHACCPKGWTPLATNVTSDIVFVTNRGQQGPIPLPTYNYDVKNLNGVNQAQTDNNEDIEIIVSMLAPDGTLIRPVDPSAQVALNFGSNWTPASVTVLDNDGMLVTAHIPATGHGYDFYLSLRITAHTAHGITYTQTITTAVHAIS